jgi:hypothetical protein
MSPVRSTKSVLLGPFIAPQNGSGERKKNSKYFSLLDHHVHTISGTLTINFARSVEEEPDF